MPRDDAISWLWPEACATLARAERLHRSSFNSVQQTLASRFGNHRSTCLKHASIR